MLQSHYYEMSTLQARPMILTLKTQETTKCFHLCEDKK